jgi:hypothetical protein
VIRFGLIPQTSVAIQAPFAMGIKRRAGAQKNPPILSHEFIIQNHADIISCIAMVFVVGLLFQVSSRTTSLALLFH